MSVRSNTVTDPLYASHFKYPYTMEFKKFKLSKDGTKFYYKTPNEVNYETGMVIINDDDVITVDVNEKNMAYWLKLQEEE